MIKKAVCIMLVILVLCVNVCAAQDNTVMLYSPEGESVTVYEYEKDTYVALGWYEYPVERLYSQAGDSIVAGVHEVDAYKAVGWHDNLRSVQTTLYAPGGKELTVFNCYVEEYLNLGWQREKIPLKYYDGFYIFDYGVFARAACLSNSTDEGKLSYVYRLTDLEAVENYVKCLVSDGWVLYYESEDENLKETYLVDKANTMIICVMVDKTEPGYVSVTFKA